ncbi:hypothetical protein KQI11_07710 [Acetanaerobacterium sp. MSJ-12]|uniref:hypothetical protein n=1 Tax=Acetanaerobacterium sp. MSJ-12 TaxID=2841535 RepID=UPI001C0F140A|nr:hypothetical protein [Acetanaerobacterium sp. MSJ-12]MBU5420005.1 hypothetical protein [Acetanaerobacterium sp. MSJ-12]
MTEENRAKVRWLSRYQRLGQRVDERFEELAAWRSRATRMGPRLTDGPRALREGSRIEEAVERIIDIEGEIAREIDEMAAARGEIRAAVAGVEDDTLALLLEKRYLAAKTWEEIAGEMGYSTMQVWRLHQKGLESLPRGAERGFG